MPTDEQSAAPPDEPMYPEVEGFVETATEDDIVHRFDELRAELDALRGPRAEQGKRVRKALVHAEDLFRHLMTVREELAASQQAQASKKRK